MADKKVTQLTSLTAPANTDLLLIIDDPAGSPISKKITVQDLFGNTTRLVVDKINVESTTTMDLVADDIRLDSANQLVITTGIVINSDGDNVDTQIKSDNNANMLYVDASEDKIGIGTNSPTEVLDVNSDAIRVRTAQTPANSNNTILGWGVGTITWDSSYIYIAVDANTIKRASLSSF